MQPTEMKWTSSPASPPYARGSLLFTHPLHRARQNHAIETTLNPDHELMTTAPSGISVEATLDFVQHYQIQHKLGEGGYSDVYAAWDTQLQRPVALKRLKHTMGSKGATPLDEARRSAALRHPAFVRIYGLAEEAMAQWIVMELVQGQELDRLLLADGALSAEIACLLVGQATEALREIHEVGLVHGDIKPANLMVEAEHKLRILDFGVAREFEDALATQTLDNLAPLAGTLAYMAPETLLGHATSPRSDLYALGVVFYEMLTGQRPHAGLGNLSVAILMQDSDSWAFAEDTPPALIQLIRNMTARDPARRLASMAEVSQRLLAIQHGTADQVAPVVVPVSPTPTPPSRVDHCRGRGRRAVSRHRSAPHAGQ